MNFSQIKQASLLAGLSLLIAIAAILLIIKNDNTLESGKLFISPAIISDMAEINIITPENKITLLSEDHLWKIKESDYYYADFNLLHTLINTLKTSRISNKQAQTADLAKEVHLSSSPFIGNRIILKNKSGQIIDYILLGKPTHDKNSTFAKRPNDASIYTINSYFNFPQKLISWNHQPFISIDKNDIQEFTLNKSKYKRTEKGRALKKITGEDLSAAEIERFLKQFQYLSYDQVISAQNFDDTLYPNRYTISLTDFEGLVRNIEILTDNNSYWVRQTFSTTPLPTHNTNDYIQNNNFLYDGWYFKLSPSTGKELYSYANR